MKFLIVGAGGVGGYFGAKLAADGNDVTFVARGAHREAMARDGLTVNTPDGSFRIEKPQLYQDPATTGLCDLVLVCVKLWDLEPAADLIRPMLARDSAVVPLQNGVAAAGILAAKLGESYVLNGVAQISAAIEKPGVIRQTGRFARLAFGERDGSRSWRVDGLLAACESAGIEARVPGDVELESWRKFILLAPLAGAAAHRRMTVGALLADEEALAELRALVAETAAVGRAKGVALPDDAELSALSIHAGMPAEMKPSMLHDLEAGRRLELDWLSGEVVRLGRELGIPTPASKAVLRDLEPFKLGGPAPA